MLSYSIELRDNQRRFLKAAIDSGGFNYDRTMADGYYSNMTSRKSSIRFDGLTWSQDHCEKVARSLYGMIGVSRKNFRVSKMKSPQRYFLYVPGFNVELTKRAIETGCFQKEIMQGDLRVLYALVERDHELRGKYNPRWHPEFHPSELASKLKLNEGSVRGSLKRLTGILMILEVPQLKEVNIRSQNVLGFEDMCGDFRTINEKRWILPEARIEDAHRLLADNGLDVPLPGFEIGAMQ